MIEKKLDARTVVQMVGCLLCMRPTNSQTLAGPLSPLGVILGVELGVSPEYFKCGLKTKNQNQTIK